MRPFLLLLLLSACAPMLGSPKVSYGTDVATLPLLHPSTDARRWYVPVDAGNSEDWVFFVDTGYTHTACDDSFVKELGLKEQGRSRVYGELGAIPTRKARLPDLRIGPHLLTDLVCQTRDIGGTSSIDDPDEVRVAGVIGMDVLRRFRVVFDPGSGTMTLQDHHNATDLPTREGSTRLRRELVGARITMKVSLDGTEARALLDTGATDTHLDGTRLGLRNGRTRQGVVMRGTGGNGPVVRDVIHFDVEDVRVGGASCGPVTITQRKHRFGAPGLLGQDVLGFYRSAYDWQAGTAHFEPTGTPSVATWTDWSGARTGDVIQISPSATKLPSP